MWLDEPLEVAGILPSRLKEVDRRRDDRVADEALETVGEVRPLCIREPRRDQDFDPSEGIAQLGTDTGADRTVRRQELLIEFELDTSHTGLVVGTTDRLGDGRRTATELRRILGIPQRDISLLPTRVVRDGVEGDYPLCSHRLSPVKSRRKQR